MTRISFAGLFFVLLLTAAAQEQAASSGTTYVVGTCKPNITSFTTITAALAATPAPTIVDVCPGTYNEQVVITQPVTLQGVTSGNTAEAVVAVPGGGLVSNATDSLGNPVAAQLWINNAVGTVNVTDITFDASNNQVSSGEFAGIFYQNSAGTVNRVTTRNQRSGDHGTGLWIEGGKANPSVVVQNSNIHDFNLFGIEVEAYEAGTSVTATIKSNFINGGADPNVRVGTDDIFIAAGSAVTVTSNTLLGAYYGIQTLDSAGSISSTGSISSNTIVSSFAIGVVAQANGISVTSNKILNSASNGVTVVVESAVIQSNTIMETPVGIDFACLSNPNVRSNSFTNVATGIANVPGSLVTSNSYYSVGTIRSNGYCPGSH